MSDVHPPAVDASFGELFSDLTTDMSGLMRDELALAKVELKEEITKVGRAGGMFGGAALAGYMTIVLLSFAAAWGLAEVMAVGWAFLIVAVIWGAAAALLVPPRTATSSRRCTRSPSKRSTLSRRTSSGPRIRSPES